MVTRIRVLVVDDSALVRKVLASGLSADPYIEVVGTAGDPYEARDILVRKRPDVMTLDIEMPRMDGITFLRKFMPVIPTPTIVISNLTAAEGRYAVEALAAGAVEVLRKPRLTGDAEHATEALRACIRSLAQHSKEQLRPERASVVQQARWQAGARGALIALGASTGGVQALSTVLQAAGPESPPVVVAQHMPAGYTASLAEQLDRIVTGRVVEGHDGLLLQPGQVVIAPANDLHTVIERGPAGYIARCIAGDKRCFQRPSVDVLFESIAAEVTVPVVAALLTGMGNDGAAGLLALRNRGARTLCQDEATSVVFGMPRHAQELGAALRMCPLSELSAAIQDQLQASTVQRRTRHELSNDKPTPRAFGSGVLDE